MFQMDLVAAGLHHYQALDLCRAIGSQLGEANALTAIGRVALARGDRQEADRRLEEAVSIYRRIGNRYGEAAEIGNFGWDLLRLGHSDEARHYLARAAELFADMGLEDYSARHQEAVDSIDDN